MKDLLESSEAFTAHATIAAGYFMIQQAQEQLDKETVGLLPIERMVDVATGADKERLDKHKQYISICLIDIIEAKKVIGADFSRDQEVLRMLNSEQS